MKQKLISAVVLNFMVFTFISILSIMPLNAQNSEINIHYLGHSSFVIQFDNGLHVVADYGTSNAYGYDSPIFSIGSLHPDIMTFSHQHEDHCNPARIPENVQYILTELDTLSLAGLTIKPVRTSETALATKDNSSFIFTYKGLTLVHLADAQANIMNINNRNNQNYIREILPEKIDMLLMTVQGINGFIPRAETFVDFLQPKRIIPIHYWTRQYKADFLQHLEDQNQNAGKNYQIERRRGAKYALSASDTSTNPVKVISLEPALFSDFDKPDIRYNSLELIDSQGNNNSRADAGETVNLIVNLDNFWIAAENVSVALREEDPDVQVSSSIANFGTINMKQKESNTANPYVFSVSSTAIAHYTTFYLDITADGGYSVVDSFVTVIGSPTILLIDDDGGDCYETCYTDVLIPESWDVAVKGCPTIDVLQAYESVIWFTGDDRENSLTPDEQSVIASFLNNGGRLLICGQNIAYDLDGDGSASDSLFFANYLHAQFQADSSNVTVVRGSPGTQSPAD
jgi:L-ascorbate metabolism protein UlaG (beta-lactamase superfamily)